jgi:hypothetical protein
MKPIFTCKMALILMSMLALRALAAWTKHPKDFKRYKNRSEQIVYFNDFNVTPGCSFPEWSSPGYSFNGNGHSGAGAQPVTNVRSPNGAQTYLGEFGGPYIVPVGSKPVFRVEETILLSIPRLPPHDSVSIAFDLYILKSWDGDSPKFGPDRFRLSAAGGPSLINATFSNNPKISTDGSYQDYPVPGSRPWSGAVSIGTLGYNNFFKDGIYHFRLTFAYPGRLLTLKFASSLFEGKGVEDESWGLDNVRVSIINAH